MLSILGTGFTQTDGILSRESGLPSIRCPARRTGVGLIKVSSKLAVGLPRCEQTQAFVMWIFQDPESWTTFPFLVDDKTVHHVARSRVMFVMRGLPGSGKSTIVRQLEETYEKHGTVVTCSADDYFLQETGTYHFQQVRIELFCNVEQALENFTSESTIILLTDLTQSGR